ncbi:MAG: AraC family transcriptional regulator ligand-binding domain-containing protein [Geminicoccaceae bacterium]
MTNLDFGRLRDLGGLPDLLRDLAGDEGLSRVFRDQGLPVTLLDAPDTPVLMRDLVGLYQSGADVVGVRSLGLDASRGIKFEEHGPVAEYILQAPTLHQALERLRVALPYHESGSSLEIKADGDALRVGYRNVHQHLNGWRHAGDFTLCLIVSLIRAYLGSDWQPSRIEVCYERGPWEQDHEDLFAAPVRYDPNRIAVFIDRELIMSSDGAPNSKPKRILTLGDLARHQHTLPRNILEATTNIIGHRLLDGMSDLEGAAARIGLEPRTLQRRLSDFGASYRDLLLRCRMRRARELLVEPDMTVRQVGQALGYTSTPQFARAFKARLGATPSEFRRSIA